MALAGTLLHEMWHLCRWGWFVDDSLKDTNCNPPVLLENLFRWAIYTRCGADSGNIYAPKPPANLISPGPTCDCEYQQLYDTEESIKTQAVFVPPGVYVDSLVFPDFARCLSVTPP